MSERPPENPDGRQADHAGRRAGRVHALARGRSGARAAERARAVFVAPDEAAMRALADAAHYFAPELEVLTFPAWDCLPYDRSSPSLRATSERLATLHALQRTTAKPQLLVTTVNAATQRTLTPFRIRQLVARLAPGERIDRDRLGRPAPGQRLWPHRDGARSRRVRGARRPRRPVPGRRGAGAAARFLRRRDRERAPLRSRHPAQHRPDRRLHPAARLRDPARRGQRQALPLRLSRIVRRRRDRRPALPGGVGRPPASPASTTGCPCSRSGWRPCSTISATTTSSSAIPATPARSRRGSRRSPIITRTGSARRPGSPAATGRWRPRRSISPRDEWDALVAARPLHQVDAVPRARERRGDRFRDGRRRAISRRSGRRAPTSTKRWSPISPRCAAPSSKVVLASYSAGSRERLKGLLADHGLDEGASRRTAGRKRSAPRGRRARRHPARPRLHRRATSPCSPSRTCSATGWSAAASAARAPTPSSPSSRRSPPATSSSTPITASAATRG